MNTNSMPGMGGRIQQRTMHSLRASSAVFFGNPRAPKNRRLRQRFHWKALKGYRLKTVVRTYYRRAHYFARTCIHIFVGKKQARSHQRLKMTTNGRSAKSWMTGITFFIERGARPLKSSGNGNAHRYIKKL